MESALKKLMKFSCFSVYTDDDIEILILHMKCNQDMVDLILDYSDDEFKKYAIQINELLSDYSFPCLNGSDYQIVLQYILNVQNSWNIIQKILFDDLVLHKSDIMTKLLDRLDPEMVNKYSSNFLWNKILCWFKTVQKDFGILNSDGKWNGSWDDTSPFEAISEFIENYIPETNDLSSKEQNAP